MIIYEVIKINKGLCDVFAANGLRVEDAQWVELYDEYNHLRTQGEKTSYIVCYLSEKYRVSERKVYDVVKKFGQELRWGN